MNQEFRHIWKEAYERLVLEIMKLGFPKEFGDLIAKNLGSPQAMDRMRGYLREVKPQTMEDIADEMLAINSDISRWKEKKNLEYYNGKYNELLYYGLSSDDEEEDF